MAENKSVRTILQELSQESKVSKPNCRMVTRRVLRGHFGKIYSVSWSYDSRRVVSACQDGKLIVWNTRNAFKEAVIELKSSWVLTCAFSPNGENVATGGLDNVISIYRIPSEIDKKISNEKPTLELSQHEGYISCCRFMGDNQVLSSSGDGTCILWDLEKQAAKQIFTEHKSDVMSISINDVDPNLFVTGSTDTLAKVWDIRQSGKTSVISYSCHDADINCVAFLPDGSAFGTASDDGSAGLFDLRAQTQLNSYSDTKILGALTSCTFSGTGRFLFTSDDEDKIYVWDTLHGSRVNDLLGHEARVSCVQVSPDGTALASASWDSLVRIWA